MKRQLSRKPLRVTTEVVRSLDSSSLEAVYGGANRASVLNNGWGNCSAGNAGSCTFACMPRP